MGIAVAVLGAGLFGSGVWLIFAGNGLLPTAPPEHPAITGKDDIAAALAKKFRLLMGFLSVINASSPVRDKNVSPDDNHLFQQIARRRGEPVEVFSHSNELRTKADRIPSLFLESIEKISHESA
jgi:hypothetical protein